MTSILCKGLDGATPQEILDLPQDFVTRIVGAELVRVRSQTTYYVLSRIKGICKVYLDRQRALEAEGRLPVGLSDGLAQRRA
jgi:cysteine desulfuration protein SufE